MVELAIAGLIVFVMISGLLAYVGSRFQEWKNEVEEAVEENTTQIEMVNERVTRTNKSIKDTDNMVERHAGVNKERIELLLDHLDLKLVEKSISWNMLYGHTIDRHIEPKTDNEKQIEKLEEEIEILKSLDKE